MRLSPDTPLGRPSFALSADQIATCVDLICRGAAEARKSVTTGMLEVPITVLVEKAMRRLKRELGLTNLEVNGAYELLEAERNDSTVLGRIDITLRFLHQFGDEDAYLGVECKRVVPGDSSLNRLYVTKGVNRFVTGQYASGHHWGVMLGYVMACPAAFSVAPIDTRMRKTYGDGAGLSLIPAHAEALSMHTGLLTQQGGRGHRINVLHIFVDMSVGSASAAKPPGC